MIVPCLAIELMNFTNIFSCSNLVEDINYTLSMFTDYVNNERLTNPEKYFMSNKSCSTAKMMKEDLEGDLCSQETDSLALDKRNNLAKYIDSRIAIFCGDFFKVQGELFIDCPKALAMT